MTKGNEKGNDEDSEKEKRISPNANEEKVETNGAHALSQPKPIDSTKKAMASADVVDETIVKVCFAEIFRINQARYFRKLIL